MYSQRFSGTFFEKTTCPIERTLNGLVGAFIMQRTLNGLVL